MVIAQTQEKESNKSLRNAERGFARKAAHSSEKYSTVLRSTE